MNQEYRLMIKDRLQNYEHNLLKFLADFRSQ